MLYDRITDNGKVFTAEYMICLVPLVLMSVFYYGFRSMVICLVSMAACYFIDMICIYARNQKFEFEDVSSITTGLILALLMPATITYSKLIIAAAFTIVLGKQVFGGNENIVFQPVTVGYALATLCWREDFLMFPKPIVNNSLTLGDTTGIDKVHSLTHFFDSGVIPQMDQFDVMMGKFCGPMGTTHIIVLGVCSFCMILRKKSSFTTLLFACGLLAATTAIKPKVAGMPFIYSVAYEMITGATLFVLVFIASDSRIVPITFVGKALYGLAIGGMTVVFRRYAMVEQGIIFAVILAGVMVPTFDKIGGSSRVQQNQELLHNIYDKNMQNFNNYRQRFIK